MLRPTKFSDPRQTVIPIAADILDQLRRKRVQKLVDLRQRERERYPGADRLFVPALGLLFILGRVEYRVKTDSFEYIGPS